MYKPVGPKEREPVNPPTNTSSSLSSSQLRSLPGTQSAAALSVAPAFNPREREEVNQLPEAFSSLTLNRLPALSEPRLTVISHQITGSNPYSRLTRDEIARLNTLPPLVSRAAPVETPSFDRKDDTEQPRRVPTPFVGREPVNPLRQRASSYSSRTLRDEEVKEIRAAQTQRVALATHPLLGPSIQNPNVNFRSSSGTLLPRQARSVNLFSLTHPKEREPTGQ